MKWISTLLLSLTLAFSAHAAEQRPNFVVIFTDDQTYRAIGYNNPVVKTPNLDKLAMEGVRLNRAYVASPICVASRASILTGAFPQQHAAVSLFSTGFKKSVVVEKRFVTLPIVLEQAGYHTALYGKSHLGEPTTFGFAEGRDIKAANDEETFEEADKFFQRESKSGRPFLFWLTPHNPHVPYSAPQRFKDLYKDTIITLDPNWMESPPMQSFFNQAAPGDIGFRDGKLSIYKNSPAGQTCGPPRSAEAMKEVIKAYYGDVSRLDEQVGTLVEQMKAAGLYENTILIFLSDNGYHLGNHGLGNKITMHEESVRVPMFVHSPLLPVKGAKSEALVSSLDVFPTILDYAGITAPAQLMGKSLRPIMHAPESTVRECVFTECVGPPENRVGTGHRMARTDHFKYMLTTDDEEAFFDLRTDPYEMKNLIADPSQSAEIERHRALLRGWSSSVGEKRLSLDEATKRPASKKKAKSKKAA
jgi:arylsulfatase A-like enzyme